MRLTTETAIGQILFKSLTDAEQFVAEMTVTAADFETFEIRPYQGNRFHVARFYNGTFEAYC